MVGTKDISHWMCKTLPFSLVHVDAIFKVLLLVNNSFSYDKWQVPLYFRFLVSILFCQWWWEEVQPCYLVSNGSCHCTSNFLHLFPILISGNLIVGWGPVLEARFDVGIWRQGLRSRCSERAISHNQSTNQIHRVYTFFLDSFS